MLSLGKKYLIYILFLTLILPVAGFPQIRKVKAEITKSGTSSGKYPPANFGVDISSYNIYKDSSGNPTTDPKMTFYWAGAKGVLDSGSPYTADEIDWVLNIYTTSVTPEKLWPSTFGAGTWTDHYDNFNKDGSGYVNYTSDPTKRSIITGAIGSSFKWGEGTFRAQLDLRVEKTGDNIGTAIITFSMPDEPPSITSTETGTGECPVQNIKAYPETNAYGNQEAVIHFSWDYNKDPKCKDLNHGVFITNPNNAVINHGWGTQLDPYATGRYATDTKGMLGIYTFCTIEHYNAGLGVKQECHGINTINVDKFELEGTSITGNAIINEQGGPGGAGGNESTCGVGIGEGIFVQALGGALCALISLIGDFTGWIMEHLFGSVFDAYVSGKHIVFNYLWPFG